MGQGRRISTCGLTLALLLAGCGGAPEGKLTLALKYVSYLDSSESPAVSEIVARALLPKLNAIWSQCDVGFQLESYEAIDPGAYGLRYQTRDLSELQDIRERFDAPTELLLVATGPWDRAGSLGNSMASAWTVMPAFQGPFGAVMEQNAGSFDAMIGHELGHYLGLKHVSDEHDVMNPVIFSWSWNLSADQCKTARTSIGRYWLRALRS